MQRALRLLALLLALGAAGLWLATGAHRGWTQTSVQVKKLDEATGIEGISYETRFLPGIDFVGASALGAGLLAAASFLFRKKTKTETPA